ncbi:MAG: UvrD-helicase domain-containing protein [Lentisphaerae bacterium]|nr:UvrD-helicase domain-containing protein [Lentisphaerota bacterium]
MSPELSVILSDLTEAQLAAVTHKDGPMLVIAGAGSGKTRVVTRRLAWLVAQGVWPAQIVAMTFTNKAAREMRERVNSLCGQALPNVSTFHSLCARFLRQEIERGPFGRDRNFVIYDDSEQQAIIKQCLSQLPRQYSGLLHGKEISAIVSKSKNDFCSFAEAIEALGSAAPELALRMCRLYEEGMQRCNAVDFDDLLYFVVKLLQENPALREVYLHRWRYLLIDEYQDTNHLQYLLMRLLTSEQENVHVTGDPDQCIYSWRGADYRNIMDFTRDFPTAKIVKLEQNYRSTQNILEVANCLIANNRHRFAKSLFTHNEEGNRVEVIQVPADRDEGTWICRTMQALLQQGRAGCWREMAVLYRTNSQSRTLEEAMMQFSIPYQIIGGVRFYDRREIKDFLAVLRLKVNPSDIVALKRLLAFLDYGIGAVTLEKINQAAAAQSQSIFAFLCSDAFRQQFGSGSGSKARRLNQFSHWCVTLRDLQEDSLPLLVSRVLEHSGLAEALIKEYDRSNAESRINNLDSLLARVHEFAAQDPEAGLQEFLAEVALVADVDAHDPSEDSVVLMTMHSAKGLEFPFVFIAGAEEGLLPHQNAEDLEEERRLFYVAITRARKNLYILWASSRFLFGKNDYFRIPSSFLQELPPGTVSSRREQGSASGHHPMSHGKKARFSRRYSDPADDEQTPFTDDVISIIQD